MARQRGFDINVLQQEAHTRWLKPSEVLFILQNYERYPLSQEPSQKPPSGSLFLFNRRVLRFFRKDGHSWRRKKDGRTIGEAHERLKVGNADALNCYYAHGEHNPYFQRRVYWMLDPAYDHIVLVHYREVAEGRYISGSISNFSMESYPSSNHSTSIVGSAGVSPAATDFYEQHRSSQGSAEEVSSKFVIENYDPNNKNALDRLKNDSPSSQSEVKHALQKPKEQLSLGDDGNSFSANTVNNHVGLTLGKLSNLYQTSGSVEKVGPAFALEDFSGYYKNSINNDGSSQPTVNQALQKLAEQLSLDDEDDYIYLKETMPSYSFQKDTLTEPGFLSIGQSRFSNKANENLVDRMPFKGHDQINDDSEKQSYTSIHQPKDSGDNLVQSSQQANERNESQSWNDLLKLSSSSAITGNHGKDSKLFSMDAIPESSRYRETLFPSSGKDEPSASLFETAEKISWGKADMRQKDQGISENELHLQLSAARNFLLGSENLESPITLSDFKDLGEHQLSEKGLMLHESRTENEISWMGATIAATENSTFSSDISSTWLDDTHYSNSLEIGHSLTLVQHQRFSIREISPEWAFSFESTKVVITGQFLCNPLECSWAAMFDDIEVPLEFVQEGVLRCQAPQHDAGKVILCITSGNRECCSEIREFEFRSNPYPYRYLETSTADATKSSEEISLLARFVYMLLNGHDFSSASKDLDGLRVESSGKLKAVDSQWHQMIEALCSGCGSSLGTIDWIMQELLKDKLQSWLSSKCRDKQTECLLSKQEQGIIHLISGLGYEWALAPLLKCRVGINFRDANGWTALHWAAHCGREKMVAALLAAGASPGVVTDPTPQDPVGKSPGFLASARGHKGLAGYLSEVALTSHLSFLAVEENEISKGSAEVEAEKAVASISERSVEMHGGTEDELSLKDSLAAVRNAAQAAARIQAAFRAHSFLRRQQKAALSVDDYGMTPGDIQGILAASKSHRSHDQKFDKAALSIQKKYRGWKGRKDFLFLRQNVVKIQAVVRGYQVRKKYKVFIWTVSIVEKVILRWRRRGVGLRGFRAEPEMIDGEEEEDIAKVFRKQKVDAAVDEAVSRVLSMVDSPDARQQYRRMLERFHQAKAELSNLDEATSRHQD